MIDIFSFFILIVNCNSSSGSLTEIFRDGSLMRFQKANNAISQISTVMKYKTLLKINKKLQNMRFRIDPGDIVRGCVVK